MSTSASTTSAPASASQTRPRVLSGSQPSGKLHLGNLFGAIRQYVALQDQGDPFYFIADYHALTTVRDAAKMRELVRDVALDYLALGVDPKRATMYRQSDLPEVCELSWLLTTVTPMGMLERAHSYKDKVAQGISPDAGLFCYPVLMAADILLFRANLVPVGKDQKQHLEITRDIAVKFNQTYCPEFDPHTGEGGVLSLPDPYILDTVAVVPGTDGRKMSKSYGNTIDLFGSDKELKKSVMRIVTDSTPMESPKDPEACNVFALLKLFCDEAQLEEIAAQYRAGGTGYGHFKTLLLEKIHQSLDSARKLRTELESSPDYVEEVLRNGAERARNVARAVLADVRRMVGF